MVCSYTNQGRGTRGLTLTWVSNIVHYTVRMLITTASRARLLKVTMEIHVNERSDSDDTPPPHFLCPLKTQKILSKWEKYSIEMYTIHNLEKAKPNIMNYERSIQK